ncbi:MAG: glycoside hydrolase family 127 protein [Candidatus Latescibacteria bacterium]|jgi:uncharacterized protein|nr:glycoside hydrolase family 127 protein [Candidatus Latescibacterota bacterium]
MPGARHGTYRRIQPLPLKDITIDDDFWTPRIDMNRHETLDYQLRQCEETGRIANYDRAAGKLDGEFEGIFFNDSDVYKWMEAAAYSLATHPDGALEDKLDIVISKVADAQEEDGYLNTYFSLVEPDKKWTNLGIMHELYCAGHLFQAAVAHFQSTGKRSLLDVACKFADHIDDIFGPGRKAGMPGHEEIELALVDLYRVTGREQYLKLAQYFIDQRGQEPSVFELEIENAGTGGRVEANRSHFLVNGSYDGRYTQDHLPIREQSEVVGHAVRAMYLYSAMADVVGETGEKAIRDALERLWRNVTLARMYITGGIGPSSHNEGFTDDYHLPNTTAYAETCAAIGNVIWNWRMLMLEGDARYADVMEMALYNGFLSGLALDGKNYFYVNPLRSNGDRHREGWFGCACCPPNIARLLASLGSYAYGQSDDGLWINLYIGGKAKAILPDETLVVLEQSTNYPWDGKINVSVRMPKTSTFALYLRIPGWCESASLNVNGKPWEEALTPGKYLRINRTWSDGDTISLSLPMEVQKMEAHPGVTNNIDHIALQRGPVIYCLEETDHDTDVHAITLDSNAEVRSEFEAGLLGGVCVLKADAHARTTHEWSDALYRPHRSERPQSVSAMAVPYYVWDNREQGKMTVWIRSE